MQGRVLGALIIVAEYFGLGLAVLWTCWDQPMADYAQYSMIADENPARYLETTVQYD